MLFHIETVVVSVAAVAVLKMKKKSLLKHSLLLLHLDLKFEKNF
jgi:hypothetical protein